MRSLRQSRHAFRFGFALTRCGAGVVAVVLVRLFLSFVKIEFVQTRARTDFVNFDVPGLVLH